MKKIIIILTVLSLNSCTKNSTQINVVKKNLEIKLSKLEMKDVKISCKEISDREALNEIMSIHQKDYDGYATESSLKNIYEDLKKLESLKGEDIYYKIQAVKANPDTTFYQLFYLDNKDSIILKRWLK